MGITPTAVGYTSSDGFAATFPSRGRLSERTKAKTYIAALNFW